MKDVRTLLINAQRKHLEGHVDKHLANLEILFSNPVGIGEHQDIMEAIEIELEQVSKYEDMLEVLENYFEE